MTRRRERPHERRFCSICRKADLAPYVYQAPSSSAQNALLNKKLIVHLTDCTRSGISFLQFFTRSLETGMAAVNLTALLGELNEAVLVYRSETDVLRAATADLKLKVTIGIGLILLILIIEMFMLFGTIFYTVTKNRSNMAYKLLDSKISTINKFGDLAEPKPVQNA